MNLEQLQEFFRFLMKNEQPDEWCMTPHPEMDERQAFGIIYFLQERLHIIPDNFELCADCLELFDDHHGGTRQVDGAQVCADCAQVYDFCCSGCCEYVTFGTVDDDGFCERCRERKEND